MHRTVDSLAPPTIRTAAVSGGTRVRPWLPHAGLLGIPLSCLLALEMIPDVPSGEGALMLPAWLLAAGLLTGMIAEVILYGVQEVFRTEHLILVGVILVVFPELLQPFYTPALPPETIRKTLLAVAIFGTSFALGSSLPPGRLPRALAHLAARNYSNRIAMRITLACWALGMLSYAAASNFSLPVMLNGLLEDRWSAPWTRGQFGDWGAFRDHLSYFGYSLPTFAVLIRLRAKSWTDPYVLTALLCSATFLPFPAQGGGRRIIVAILGAGLLTWLCANRHNLNVRHYIAFATISILVVIALDAILTQRNEGFRELKYKASDFTALKVDDNFDSLGHILRTIPEQVDYLYLQYVWYVMVRPIPRVFWEGKPLSGGFDLAAYQGRRGVSLSITIIGELYMSYGWVAVIVGGVLLGWAARKWSQFLDANFGPTALALYALGSMCLFLGIRSMQELVLMSYPVLCWWVLDLFLSTRANVPSPIDRYLVR